MFIDEKSRAYSVITRRADNAQCLGQRTKISVTNGSTRSNCLFGCRRYFESGYCPETSNFSSYRSTLAPAVPIPSSRGAKERCPTTRQIPKNYTAENQRCCSCHSSHDPRRCDSLEHANNGQGSRFERGNRSSYMAQAQFETAPCRNLQTQSGQTLYRKIARCCRPIFESTGQSDRLLCRREESNPSIRTHTNLDASTPGRYGSSDTRLYTTRDNNVIRSFKHARWTGYRRLHASPSASRVHSVLTAYQCQDSARSGLTPDRRQLWNTQTPTCSKMAEASSEIPSAFYSNIQFMVEYGGTMVR